jgi:hypothetical protein
VTNTSLFDKVLREVNADVQDIQKPGHMIFLEFARPSYVDALANFDGRILDNCVVFYMDVGFDICWQRNVARHESAVAAGGDDHLTSREEMERTFRHDDRDSLVKHLGERGIPMSVVNNEAQGEEHLSRQVEEVYDQLFNQDYLRSALTALRAMIGRSRP